MLDGKIQINAPEMDIIPLSEFMPGYIPLTFPTLFPDGKGDFHQPHQWKVELGEYFTHLLQFCGGCFVQHKWFLWFVFNTLQCHRTHRRSKIFVKQHYNDAQMTAEQIEELLCEGDNSLVNKMMRFDEDLRGTWAYWLACQKRCTLISERDRAIGGRRLLWMVVVIYM